MKTSVIITCYNLEAFVAASIDSVLSQTVKADEILVVDDGSTDNSANVIASFGEKVKLIRMPQNAGVLPAFIEGIKAAKGDILAFLDGDDIWMPQKLERVLGVFRAHEEVMMVTHMHQWIDKDARPTGTIDATHRNCRRITALTSDPVELDALIKNSILCYKGIWLGSAFCIRRNALDLADYTQWVFSLPKKELSHQDQPLAAYLIYKHPARRICLINEALFQYRVCSTNSSGISVNRESALRTMERSWATVIRTKNIVEQRQAWKEANRIQAMKLLELEFLRVLYNNEKLGALKKYMQLFVGYWDMPMRVKETKRLLLCFVLGSEKFLQVKTKKRFS